MIECPFCLTGRVSFQEGQFRCPECKEPVAKLYIQFADLPRVVISAVGFPGHGKTVYFGSLFHCLDEMAHVLHGFHTLAVDERSLDTVRENQKQLARGELPAATPKNFPKPTLVKFASIPDFGDRLFLFYDTSGEAFERASQLVQYAGYVKRSRTAIFFVSLADLEGDAGVEMHRLLQVYIQGMAELGGHTRDQHLIVVFTKGDKLEPVLGREVWDYLRSGGPEGLSLAHGGGLKQYIRGMEQVSKRLRTFALRELKAYQFIHACDANFRSVELAVLSSLGAEPAGTKLSTALTPKRVMDPILWALHKSRRGCGLLAAK